MFVCNEYYFEEICVLTSNASLTRFNFTCGCEPIFVHCLPHTVYSVTEL
jgi:hypothetical protein